jgi:hypothetical protein
MGLLGNILGAITSTSAKRQPIQKTIPFDSNWFDSWESLRIEQQRSPNPIEISVSFDDALLGEIWNSIESHAGSARILYDEEQQPINNVGESYRQKQIADFCGGKSGEELGWLSGFLMPELANPHDKTAVAIYVIKPINQEADSNAPFALLHGGYMDRESAKKVHKKILNLMGKDQYIPLLIRVQGGTSEKPNYGVFAYAKTTAIRFP